MTNELKPCPFCGGEARLASESYIRRPDCLTHWAWCSDCGAAGGYKVTEQEAIEAWNQRAEKSCEQTKRDGECAWLMD